MDKFTRIASELFKLPPESFRDAMSSKDIPEWDSMNYLLFIAELEKEFGLSFSMDEVIQALTLGDIRRIVETRATIHDS